VHAQGTITRVAVTWETAQANSSTFAGPAHRTGGAVLASQTSFTVFAGSANCALLAALAGEACSPTHANAALGAGEASGTNNAAGAHLTRRTDSARLADFAAVPSATALALGASFAGETNVANSSWCSLVTLGAW
jgi:hypothetical protein